MYKIPTFYLLLILNMNIFLLKISQFSKLMEKKSTNRKVFTVLKEDKRLEFFNKILINLILIKLLDIKKFEKLKKKILKIISN